MALLRSEAGTAFDARCVDALEQVLDREAAPTRTSSRAARAQRRRRKSAAASPPPGRREPRRAGTSGARARRSRRSRPCASPTASCGFAGAAAPTTPAGTARCSSRPGSRSPTLPLVSPLDAAGERRSSGAHARARADRRRRRRAAAARGARAAALLLRPGAVLRARSCGARRCGERPGCCARREPRRVGARLSPRGMFPPPTTSRSRTSRCTTLEHATFVLAGLARLDAARRSGRHGAALARAAARLRGRPVRARPDPRATCSCSRRARSTRRTPRARRSRPALNDQQLAGLVMMAEQLVTLGACAALLLRSALRGGRGSRPARSASVTSSVRDRGMDRRSWQGRRDSR